MSAIPLAVFALPKENTNGKNANGEPASKKPARSMATVANEMRTSLSKCDTLLGQGKSIDAAKAILDGFAYDRNNRSRRIDWRKVKWCEYEIPFAELLRLVFSNHQDSDLRMQTMVTLRSVRNNLRGNSSQLVIFWEGVMQLVRRNLESLVNDAAACRKAAQEKVASNAAATLMADVVGIEADELVGDGFAVDGFIKDVLETVLDTAINGFALSMQKIYFDFIRAFIPVMEYHQLTRSLRTTYTKAHRYLNQLLYASIEIRIGKDLTPEQQRRNRYAEEIRTGREVFSREPAMIERAVSALLALMNVNVNLGLWSGVWEVVFECLKLLDSNTTDQEHTKIRTTAFRAMSSVFFGTGNTTFAAHCLSKAASIQCKYTEPKRDEKESSRDREARERETAALLTMAVAAAICAPEFAEGRAMFGASEIAFKHSVSIARGFALDFAPSRSSILRDLEAEVGQHFPKIDPAVKSLLDAVTATAAPLDEVFKIVQGATAAIQAAAPLLNLSIKLEESLLMPIRRVALSRVVERRLQAEDALLLTEMHANVGDGNENSFDKMYLNLYEPMLLDDIAHPVLLDLESRVAKFVLSSFDRMNRTFLKVATLATLTPKEPSVLVSRPPLQVPVTDFELELVRGLASRDLAAARKNKEAQREAEQLKRIEDERNEAVSKRADEEKQKQQKQNEVNNLKMKRDYERAELRERHKMLISRLQEKHKGLKVPAGIELLNHQSFMDNLTRVLTAFVKESENQKLSDVRTYDYFERACRERDIPKRKELAASMAAQLEKEREERWENYLVQHRVEYDAKVALRERLSKLLEPAKRYEESIKARSAPKPTKRDEQEDLLRAEKARLAAAAGLAAPAAAAVTHAAAPVAATASAAEAQKASGPKWQPKARS